MAQRIGFYSLKKHAGLVCRFIAKFGTVIKEAKPNAVALHVALDAAYLACEILVTEIIKEEVPGI